MSPQVSLSILNPPDIAIEEARHRLLLRLGYALAVLLVLGLTLYGFDYYFLEVAQRPFSPKHLMLRPTGLVGLWLGIIGAELFLGIFLYEYQCCSGEIELRGGGNLRGDGWESITGAPNPRNEARMLVKTKDRRREIETARWGVSPSRSAGTAPRRPDVLCPAASGGNRLKERS